MDKGFRIEKEDKRSVCEDCEKSGWDCVFCVANYDGGDGDE